MSSQLSSISELIIERNIQLLSKIKRTNERTIDFSQKSIFPKETSKKIHNPSPMKLVAHLEENLFIGIDKYQVKIVRLQFQELMKEEKPPRGFEFVEIIHEFKGLFKCHVSDNYIVTYRWKNSGGCDYYVYDWRSGKMVFNLLDFKRIDSFVAIYRNGYCLVLCSIYEIRLINMMEKSKKKIFVQYNVNYSRNNFQLFQAFEAPGNRIVIMGKFIHIFKWDLKSGTLEEEFVIKELTGYREGCMIDEENAMFKEYSQNSQNSETKIIIYNLQTKQILKTISKMNDFVSEMKHIGLNSMLFGHYFYNYETDERVEIESASFSNGNNIFEYGDLLFSNSVLSWQLGWCYTETNKIFKKVFPKPKLSSVALVKFSDIQILLNV